MHVLSVVAHPRNTSFTHAVLERFHAGVEAAEHTHDIVESRC
ncbi:MAG: putative NADPH-quinone reductase [Gammaproteobacteria bacterium]|jgi:putative NADPH-quinone reductase